MNVVIDTSVLLAIFVARDAAHAEAVDWLNATTPTLHTTPLVLAELDHLLGVRAGLPGQRVLWDNLEQGSLGETWWPLAGVTSAQIAASYADMMLGLTDASLIALAGHLGTTLIATLDERHFRVARPVSGGTFTLLPTDR